MAKGFTQIPRVDFFESYASVVHYESLRMNLAIAAANNIEAWQINYVAAYLNSLPQAKVYIKLHDGTITELLYLLYRLMDGTYNWWDTLDKDMADLGYYHSKADPSVHSRHANREVTITSTYTDDTTGVSSLKEEADRAKEKLERIYKTKDLGEAGLVLEIKIKRDRKAGTLSISQHAYLK